MVNNIGKTTQLLSKNLGETIQFNSNENITLLTGELGTGLLLFDSDGTLGVISTFTDENNFIVTTCALSIDISAILGLSY